MLDVQAPLAGRADSMSGMLAAPLASLDWLENRIINPDWKDTAVARRDARALNGALTYNLSA